MTKSKTLFVALLISIFSITLFSAQNPSLYAYSQSSSSNDQELAITLLHPHIEKAITDFYGYNRRYEIGDSKLEILERNGNVFIVKICVDTFEGAHNKYFTEMLNFTITPSTVTLKEYAHNDFIY